MSSLVYLEKLKELALPNKYTKWYCLIIQAAKNRAESKTDAIIKCGYVEKHHILPRSFRRGGYTDLSNTVYLTAKEHFICHHLLSKMVVDKRMKNAMVQAAWLMCHKHQDQKRYRITAKIYEVLKSLGPWNKGLIGMTGRPQSEKTKEKLKKINLGKIKSKETCEKMSRSMKGRIPWNKGKQLPPSAKSLSCIFVSPLGEELIYPSYRQGCLANNLPPCKVSDIRNGKIADYKGWTVRDNK